MNARKHLLTPVVLGLALWTSSLAIAQQHRATRLGNPETRFAPPLSTPADLRARFSDPTLMPDITSIAHQANWQGDLEDLFHAAATAPITDIQLPPGTRMPFMSSRENGKPVALMDVLWAGKEPVSAYKFDFISRGRFYRCITPRPCSNYYLVDLGGPKLGVDCDAPAEVMAGKPAKVCLTVRNTGDASEPNVLLFVPIPAGAKLLGTSGDGSIDGTNVIWRMKNLAPRASSQFCASFALAAPAQVPFVATVAGSVAERKHTFCETQVIGIPAILIDAIDLEDPIEIGSQVTYEIKITNQGSIPCTNLRLVVTLPENEEYVSGSGPTEVSAEGNTVTTKALPLFLAKDVATWRVVVKALKPGDVRFIANVHADEFASPIYEEESTLLYQ